MTDKELEAALKAAEPELFSDNPEVAHKAASPLKVDVARDEQVAKITAAISAYLSALPGEAEVVELVEELREQAQRFSDPTTEMLTDAADALQAMQARAEKAEIENDRLIADAQAAWSKHGGTEIALGQWKARAEAAERELSNMLQGVSDEES